MKTGGEGSGGLMLKLKFQYFGHFMQRVDSLEKTLMLGGIGHLDLTVIKQYLLATKPLMIEK